MDNLCNLVLIELGQILFQNFQRNVNVQTHSFQEMKQSGYPAVKGTYKQKAFYFRGSDSLVEPEFLSSELKKLRIHYSQAQDSLKETKNEYNKTSETLKQRENYTCALASALGEDSNTTEKNNSLRQKLEEVTQEIQSIEENIKSIKQQQNDKVMSTLVREFAFYRAEIQDQKIQVFQGIDQIQKLKKELAQISMSSEFTNSLQTLANHASLQTFHSHLKSETKKEFESSLQRIAKAGKSVNNNDEQETSIRSLFEEKSQEILKSDKLHHQILYTDIISRQSGLKLCQQIEIMNQTLVALGGEKIDVDELKSHFQTSQKSGESLLQISPSKTKSKESSKSHSKLARKSTSSSLKASSRVSARSSSTKSPRNESSSLEKQNLNSKNDEKENLDEKTELNENQSPNSKSPESQVE